MSAEAEKIVEAIKEIIEGTDEHRVRARREAWGAIKHAIGLGPAPVVIEAGEPEVPVEPAEDEPVAKTPAARKRR